MDAKRVGKVVSRTENQTITGGYAKRRLDPFAQSRFDKGATHLDLSALKKGSSSSDTPQKSAEQEIRAVQFPDGTIIEVPLMPKEQKEELEKRLSPLSQEQRQRLLSQTKTWGRDIFDEMANNSKGLQLGNYSAGLTASTGFTMEQYVLTAGAQSEAQTYQDLTLLGVDGMEKNLTDYMTQLSDKHDNLETMRVDVAELNEMLEGWPPGETQRFSWHEMTRDANGQEQFVEHKNVEMNKEDAQKLVEKLGLQIDAGMTMSNLEQVKLQTMVQDYQKAMNVISNILKSQDDTLRNTIANAKA